jgi:hypothetical protein
VTAIPASVRKTVLDRAQGRCERCGKPAEHLELHHRQYRSRGGKHLASNIVALDGWGNHTGDHGWAHTTTEAEDQGFSIRSGFDPHTVKVLHGVFGLVLLDDEGGWEPA